VTAPAPHARSRSRAPRNDDDAADHASEGGERRRALVNPSSSLNDGSNPFAVVAPSSSSAVDAAPPAHPALAPGHHHHHHRRHVVRLSSLPLVADFDSQRPSAAGSPSSRRGRSTDSLGPAWRASINSSFDAALGALTRPAAVGETPTTPATPSSQPPLAGGSYPASSHFRPFGGVPAFAVTL
jgi:hypothetical protein